LVRDDDNYSLPVCVTSYAHIKQGLNDGGTLLSEMAEERELLVTCDCVLLSTFPLAK